MGKGAVFISGGVDVDLSFFVLDDVGGDVVVVVIVLLLLLLMFRYIGSSNDGMGLGAVLPALVNILILATGQDIKVHTSALVITARI